MNNNIKKVIKMNEEIKPKDWTWMLKESLEKAKPHHNFHTLEIYRRRGFFKSNMPKKLFENMSNCCILWGKVVEKPTNGWVIVEYEPIEFFEGKLRIGIPQNKKIQLIDPSIKQWDEVSIHWNYVCDKITQKQKERLAVWTQLHLDLTNKTL